MARKETPEQRSKNMRAIRSKGTKPELAMAKALTKRGLRYRKNCKKVPGTPDFAFLSLKIAIFCDGEFWHGKDWEVRKNDFKSRKEFWIPKIERNMLRDAAVNELLKKHGWTIMRFWNRDVLKNTDLCADEVLKAVNLKKIAAGATHRREISP